MKADAGEARTRLAAGELGDPVHRDAVDQVSHHGVVERGVELDPRQDARGLLVDVDRRFVVERSNVGSSLDSHPNVGGRSTRSGRSQTSASRRVFGSLIETLTAVAPGHAWLDRL